MQIVIRLEQRDFEGNKEVFDRMYGLCSVLNKKTGPVEMTKAEVEKSANVVREEQTSDDTPTEAKGLLQEMGYGKVTEIPPERYAEAMTRIGDVK